MVLEVFRSVFETSDAFCNASISSCVGIGLKLIFVIKIKKWKEKEESARKEREAWEN